MAGGVCEVGHRDITKPEREELKGHTFRCAVGRLSFCHPEQRTCWGRLKQEMTTLQDRPAKSFVCVVVIGSRLQPARDLLFETFRQPVRSCRQWPVKDRPSHAFLLTCVTLRVTVENGPLAPPQRTKASLRGRRSSRRH